MALTKAQKETDRDKKFGKKKQEQNTPTVKDYVAAYERQQAAVKTQQEKSIAGTVTAIAQQQAAERLAAAKQQAQQAAHRQPITKPNDPSWAGETVYRTNRPTGAQNAARSAPVKDYTKSSAFQNAVALAKKTTVTVSEKDMRDWFKNASDFVGEYLEKGQKIGFGKEQTTGAEFSKRWQELSAMRNQIGNFLYQYKQKNGRSYNAEYERLLEDYDKYTEALSSGIRRSEQFHKKWETEAEYNGYVQQQKQAQKDYEERKRLEKEQKDLYRQYDVDAGQKELDRLTEIRQGIQSAQRAMTALGAAPASMYKISQDRIAALLRESGFSSLDELEAAIEKQRNLLQSAKLFQARDQYENAAKQDKEYGYWVLQGEGIKNTGAPESYIDLMTGKMVYVYGDVQNPVTWARDNAAAIRQAEQLDPTYVGNSIYTNMTDDEVRVYNYWLAKERAGKAEKGAAQKYLETLEKDLNEREGQRQAAGMQGQTVQELLFGVKAGLDQWGSGVANLFDQRDYIPPSATQVAAGAVRADLESRSKVGRVAFDVITNVANMAPSIVIGAAAGGAAGLAGAGTALAGTIAGWGNALAVGTSAAGSAFAEMRNAGYSKAQSYAYAALTGASEAALEKALNGISALGKTAWAAAGRRTLSEAAKGISNVITRFALEHGAQFAANAASEGVEEGLQEILSPLFKTIITGDRYEVSSDEVLYSAFMGALCSLPFNLATGIKNGTQLRGQAKAALQNGDLATLIEIGKSFDEGTIANEIAASANENTGTTRLAMLLADVYDNMGEQAESDIRRALVENGMTEAEADANAKWIAKGAEKGRFNGREAARMNEDQRIADAVFDLVYDRDSSINQRYNNLAAMRGEEGKAGYDVSKLGRRAQPDAGRLAAGLGQRMGSTTLKSPYTYGEFMDRTPIKTEAQQSVSAYNADVVRRLGINPDAFGRNVDAARGEDPVRIESLDKNGNAIFSYRDGGTNNGTSAVFRTPGAALIWQAAAKLGGDAAAANVIANAVDRAGRQPVERQLLGLKEAFLYGKTGYPLGEAGESSALRYLTPGQIRIAYLQGQKFRDRSYVPLTQEQYNQRRRAAANFEARAKAGATFTDKERSAYARIKNDIRLFENDNPDIARQNKLVDRAVREYKKLEAAEAADKAAKAAQTKKTEQPERKKPAADRNAPTVNEVLQTAAPEQAKTEAQQKALEAYQAKAAQLDEERTKYEALKERIDYLEGKQELTAAEKKELRRLKEDSIRQYNRLKLMEKNLEKLETGAALQPLAEAAKNEIRTTIFAVDADGKRVRIASIKSRIGGEVTLIDADGNEVKLSALTLTGVRGEATADFINEITRKMELGKFKRELSRESANAALAAFMQSEDADPAAFADEWYTQFGAGAAGVTQETAANLNAANHVLTGEQMQAAWDDGNRVSDFAPGVRLLTETELNPTQEAEIDVLERVAQKYGRHFVVADRIYSGGRLADVNGLRDGSVLVLALETGGGDVKNQNILTLTAYHEAFHLLGQMGEEGRQFREFLTDSVLSYLKNTLSAREYERLFRQRENAYGNNRALLKEEIAAQYLGTLMAQKESGALEAEITKQLSDSEDLSKWEKFVATMKAFLADLRAGIKRLARRDSAVAAALDTEADAAEMFVSTFERALNAVKNKTPAGDGGVDYSFADFDKPITRADIQKLRTLFPKRKSVNDFTQQELEATAKWAYKYYKQMGVKSPFFRAWFGDWRANDRSFVKIVEIPTVSDADLKQFLINQRTLDGIENLDTKEKDSSVGWIIKITGQGEKNTKSHSGNTKLSESALTGIRDLIKNAVLLDTEIHEHHTNNSKSVATDPIAFNHRFYALGKTGDNSINLYRITVEDRFQDSKHTNEYMFHNLKHIEKVATYIGGRHFGNTQKRDGTTYDESTTDFRVSDLYRFVKSFDKEFNIGREISPLLLNADGTPKMLYHQTDADFNIFDTHHEGAGNRDNETPFGIFMKSTADNIGVKGSRQMRLYARMANPLSVQNRAALVKKLQSISPDFAAAYQKGKEIDNEYKQKMQDANAEWMQYLKDHPLKEGQTRKSRNDDPEFNRLFDAEHVILEEWTRVQTEQDRKTKDIIVSALQQNGYDGVILTEDQGSWGRKTDAYIALEPNQVKSAETGTEKENIGTFSRYENRIDYSKDLDVVAEEALGRGQSDEALEQTEILRERAGRLINVNLSEKELRALAPTNKQIAALLRKRNFASRDARELNEMGAAVHRMLENLYTGRVGFAGFMTELAGLMQREVESAGHWGDADDGYVSDFKKQARGAKIYLAPDIYKTVAENYGGRGGLRNAVLGKFWVTDDRSKGWQGLDTFYDELRQMGYEGLLPETTDPGTQIENLLTAFRMGKPVWVDDAKHNDWFGETAAEVGREEAYKLLQELIEATPMAKKLSADDAADQRLRLLNERIRAERKAAREAALQDARNAVENRAKALKRNADYQIAVARIEAEERVRAAERLAARRMQDAERRIEQARESDRLKADIRRKVRALNKLLVQNANYENVPESAKRAVTMLLSLFSADRDIYSRQEIKDLAFEYNRILMGLDDAYTKDAAEKDDPGSYAAFAAKLDAGIGEELRYMLDQLQEQGGALAGKGADRIFLRTLTTEQAQTVMNAVDNIAFAVRNANDVRLGERKENAAALGQRAIAESGSKSRKVSKFDGVNLVKDYLGMKMLTPIYFFREKLGGVFGELFDPFLDAQDGWAVKCAAAQDFFGKTKEQYHYKDWKKQTNDFVFISDNVREGWAVTLPVGACMEVYAWKKREESSGQESHHILTDITTSDTGGVVLSDDIEKAQKKNLKQIHTSKNEDYVKFLAGRDRAIDAVVDKNRHKLTEGDIEQIVNSLTDEQKAYVDAVVGFMSGAGSQWGNEATMRQFGIRKFTEGYYFPYETPDEFTNRRFGLADDTRLKNWGPSKRTVRRAATPLVLGDFTEVAEAHMQEMALYSSFLTPIETMQTIFNFREKNGDTSVAAALANAYGTEAKKYINSFITSVNGGMRSDSVDDIYNRMTGKFKRAAVMANLSVTIQQPTALMRATALINPKYFFGAAKKSDYKEMMAHCPTAVVKAMGGFDTAMGVSAAEWIGGDADVKQKIGDAMGWGAEFADAVTWTNIWNAVKRETKAKMDLAFGSEEFWDACNKRFREIANYTQVYDSTISKSELMRSKGGLAKMVTAFMAEPTLSYNLLLMSGKDRTISKPRAITAFLLSVIVNAAFQSVIGALRDKDEERTYGEKYVSALAGNTIGSKESLFMDSAFNPLGLVPWVKDLISIVGGWDVDRSDVSVFSDFYKSAKKLADAAAEGKLTTDKVLSFIANMSSFTPLPLKSLYKDAAGIIRTVKIAATDDLQTNKSTMWQAFLEGIGMEKSKDEAAYFAVLHGETESIRRNSRHTKKDVEAYVKQGYSRADAEEMAKKAAYNDWHGKIRKGLQACDARITQAADAKEAFKWKDYERLIAEIKKDGFIQDDVVKAIDSVLEDRKTPTTDEFEPTEKAIYQKSDLDEPIKKDDKAAFDELKKTLLDMGMKEDTIKSEAKSVISKLYTNGAIEQKTAERYLETYANVTGDDAYWLFQKWDAGEIDYDEDGEPDNWKKYAEFTEAITSGGSLTDIIKKYIGHGVKTGDLTGAISDAYKEQYQAASGSEKKSLGEKLIKAYQAVYEETDKKDEEKTAWRIQKETLDKWDYYARTDEEKGYSIYNDFFDAVETGKNLRAVIKEYMDNGVKKDTLSKAITDHFKPLYLEMSSAERAGIKGYLMNAYAALGYDRSKKGRDIDKWLEKKKEE